MSEGRAAEGQIAKPGKLVTIDSESTRDIDDAMSIVALPDGRFEALFCIADPTRLVQIGSTEDANARLLGATVYNRDKAVRKMLPGHISEHKGSLVQGQPRKVLAARVTIAADFSVEAFEVSRGLVTVDMRLNYDQIPEILKNETHECHEDMRAAQALAHGIMNTRRNRGAMVLYDLQRMVFMDEEGRLKQLARREEVVGNIIVQETMVLFNTLVARYMAENSIPGLYRNHAAKPSAPMANELAQTIRTWLEAPELDLGKAESTFRMLLGKAAYGATVLGHYGLNEPCYTHASSPLRRYADLVNLRQIRAKLKGEDFPYTKEELQEMATDLNEKAELRKEERSEGFKQAVVAHAQQAMEHGTVHRLADHELSQAIALSVRDSALPDVLVEELIRRLDNSLVTDKITDRMLVTLKPESWSSALREAFVRWVREAPTRASHLLLHGRQSEWLTEAEIASTGEGTSFTGFVRVACADGRSATFSGTAPRKKDAEQVACVKAVLWLIGQAQEPGDAEPEVARAKVQGNPKGWLLEYCQKRGWPMPEFVAAGKGPSHAMIFSCRVTLEAAGRSYEKNVSGAANKKEAEALASAQLLQALGVGPGQTKTEEPAPAKGELQNPIGTLQEMAQKAKAASPEYRFQTLSEVPPRFGAVVTTRVPVAGEFRGEATTKQDAKKLAALAALKAAK